MAERKAEALPQSPIEKRVPIAVKADAAKEVVLTGDFTGWETDRVRLKRAENGEWRTVLQLPAGEYQYRLLIDGEWCNDPACQNRVPNPYGSQNDVLLVT